MRKRIISLLMCLFLLVTLTACGQAKVIQPSFNGEGVMSVSGDIVVENANYRMTYEKLTGALILEEIATGKTWGTIPADDGTVEYDDFGLPVKKHVNVQSALLITCRDNKGSNLILSSYDAVVKNGRIAIKKAENGFLAEYYFDDYEIMIPVLYTLADNYVNISIDPTQIQENETSVLSIAVAPFWCSVKNDSEDAYLFIPSGSGAIATVATTPATSGRTYSDFVYGQDLSMEDGYSATNEMGIRLPAYGVKNGDTAVLAVIDGAADSALIKATSGDTNYRYSTVYSEFQLRGYTEHKSESFASIKYNNVYYDSMFDSKIDVRFYPLTDANANYSGMANTYRDYLIKEKGLQKAGRDTTLNLTFIGGTEVTKSFLGVPYSTIYPTTTVSQASDIINDVSENTGNNLSVKLKGFGKSGINIGKIAGGYGVADEIGTVSDVKKLSNLSKDNGFSLYMDFDLINFSTSGNGFSSITDVVSTSGSQIAEKHLYNVAVRKHVANTLYYLLSPAFFDDAAEKLVDKTSKWNLTGVSLESLSSLSYSDYSTNDGQTFNSKNDFSVAVSESISKIKADNKKFMATDANLYAALAADIIVDAPTISTGNTMFLEDVPFYSMVFSGYIPMTTESVNLATNAEKTFLSAVEGGLGLNYTVINQWDNSLIDSLYATFYSTVYSAIKDDIISNSEKLSEYYSKIGDAHISSSEIVASGVHCTVFDNGVTVYVNYNDSSVETQAGVIEALDYIVLGGEA